MYRKMLIAGLTSLPRNVVRAILLVTDIAVLVIALSLGNLFIHGTDLGGWPRINLWACSGTLLLGAALISGFRLHRIKLVTFNANDVLNIARANFVTAAAYLMFLALLAAERPVATTFIFGAISLAGMVSSRAIAVALLSHLRDHIQRRKKVAIFGAGATGIQLAAALNQSSNTRVVAFFDDNPALHGMEIGGIPVFPSKNFMAHMFHNSISKMMIALPDTAQQRRDSIIKQCEYADLDVQALSSFADLLVERGSSKLRTVEPHEVLNRDKVNLDAPEVAKTYAGRVVMVTGAGGSIGAELCRQLLKCRPAKIILFEIGEYNLYRIERDLRELAQQHDICIAAYLGSVTNENRLRHVIRRENVEIIVHAAAYKHVPLVEHNEVEGARNNILGTRTLAHVAVEEAVGRFILVSTDKAVRPTSIMGTTKRIAELLVQDIQTRAPETTFSIVRFGNVLGSSGSVLPLFQAQIESGGPVTVTHPEVQRYFMTATEATRLILLAGAFASGGDVFVLDMGKPQKIINLARKLIHLSGRQEFDPKTGKGDIEIKVTGLRPGEKLYEELFISPKNLRTTPHTKIFRAEEDILSEIEIAGLMREIQNAIEKEDAGMLRKLFVTESQKLCGKRPAQTEFIAQNGIRQ